MDNQTEKQDGSVDDGFQGLALNNGEGAEGTSNPDHFATENHDEIERLKLELDTLKDKYLRFAADTENIKRRIEKEKRDGIQFATESLLRDLLPVLDAFDSATADSNPNDDNGIKLIQKMLTDKLAKNGLERIAAEGAKFDPNVHQAIQMIEPEIVDGEDELSDPSFDRVSRVFVNGYSLQGRLIRPASVQVSVPKKKSDDS